MFDVVELTGIKSKGNAFFFNGLSCSPFFCVIPFLFLACPYVYGLVVVMWLWCSD